MNAVKFAALFVLSAVLFGVLNMATGCISQEIVITLPPVFEQATTNDVTVVEAGKTNSVYTYKASAKSGGVIMTQGIYSTKKVDPETSLQIPLK